MYVSGLKRKLIGEMEIFIQLNYVTLKLYNQQS